MAKNDQKNLDSLLERLERQNKEVEKINKAAEAARARKELLTQQFFDGIKTLERVTGKKIKRNTIEKTLKEFTRFVQKTSDELERQLDEQMKVITLIHEGRYEEAAQYSAYVDPETTGKAGTGSSEPVEEVKSTEEVEDEVLEGEIVDAEDEFEPVEGFDVVEATVVFEPEDDLEDEDESFSLTPESELEEPEWGTEDDEELTFGTDSDADEDDDDFFDLVEDDNPEDNGKGAESFDDDDDMDFTSLLEGTKFLF